MSSAHPVKKNIKAVFSSMFSWKVILWYTYTFYQKDICWENKFEDTYYSHKPYYWGFQSFHVSQVYRKSLRIQKFLILFEQVF